MASVGSIVGGAFRVLFERPGAVIVWMLVYAAGAIVMALAMSLATTGTLSLAPATIAPEPGELPPGFFATMLIASLGSLLLGSLLINAVFRTVLLPEQSSMAGLRLGMAEMRTMGLIVIVGVLGFVAMFVSQLLLMLIATFMGFVAGEGVAGVILLVTMLAYLGALVWVYVRLSALFPLTLYRDKISLDAAWDLTRGRFWTLFGAYLVIASIFMVLGLAVTWATTGEYIAALWNAWGDPMRMQLAAAEFAQRQIDMPVATRIVHMILGTLLGAIALAIGPGLLASATRELLIERRGANDETDETQDWSEAEI